MKAKPCNTGTWISDDPFRKTEKKIPFFPRNFLLRSRFLHEVVNAQRQIIKCGDELQRDAADFLSSFSSSFCLFFVCLNHVISSILYISVVKYKSRLGFRCWEWSLRENKKEGFGRGKERKRKGSFKKKSAAHSLCVLLLQLHITGSPEWEERKKKIVLLFSLKQIKTFFSVHTICVCVHLYSTL